MKASYSSKKGVARNLLFFLLLFFMLPSMAIAQSTVRGIVTDDNGEPLPGVAVVKVFKEKIPCCFPNMESIKVMR